MASHAAPEQSPRVPRDGGGPMDEPTIELADIIEGAMFEVMGDSPLYTLAADVAARAVRMWLSYQVQTRAPWMTRDCPTPGESAFKE